MPYIKIEDPNIIDLAAWHQVINVVNQHSDNLAALTNNFGLSWDKDTDPDGSWRTVYDLGTQTIQYGRVKMIAGDNKQIIDGINIYQEIIDFPSAFTSAPNVVATISRSTSTTQTISDLFVTLSDIGPTSFKARVRQQNKELDDDSVIALTDTKSWYINWIAIGPQS